MDANEPLPDTDNDTGTVESICRNAPNGSACTVVSRIKYKWRESGKLLVNGHRAPWTKRGARRVGELEWRQREVREKERGAHNKEGQSVSGERPRSGKSHSPGVRN